jgi:hypothetical protein
MTTDHGDDADITDPAGVPVQTALPPLPPPGTSRRARRRRFGPLTFALAGVCIATAGFLVGVQVQKSSADNSGSSGLASAFGTGAGAGGARGAGGTGSGGGAGSTAGGGGFGGRGGAAAGVTFGQIKLVDGTNVYVTDAQGNTVKVAAANAQVTTSQPGTVGDLKPGDTVIVRGQAGKDGTVQATSVSTGGGFGGGFRGRGGGATAGG